MGRPELNSEANGDRFGFLRSKSAWLKLFPRMATKCASNWGPTRSHSRRCLYTILICLFIYMCVCVCLYICVVSYALGAWVVRAWKSFIRGHSVSWKCSPRLRRKRVVDVRYLFGDSHPWRNLGWKLRTQNTSPLRVTLRYFLFYFKLFLCWRWLGYLLQMHWGRGSS